MDVSPRKVNKPLVLYGYGKLGHLAEEIFKELGIHTEFLDKAWPNYEKALPEYDKNDLLAICVASEPYAQVIAPLVAAGWTDIVPVWDILEYHADRTGIHNGWFTGECSEEDEEGILSVMTTLFMDKISLLHYLQFRQWRGSTFSETREWVSGKYPPEPMEPLPSTLADIRARQRVDMYRGSISMTSGIVIHNEGCELKTIEENMSIFQKYRPPLSVACYHSRDGLWKIERVLMDNLPDYQWTFRLHAFMGQAAYIYGSPKERKETICSK